MASKEEAHVRRGVARIWTDLASHKARINRHILPSSDLLSFGSAASVVQAPPFALVFSAPAIDRRSSRWPPNAPEAQVFGGARVFDETECDMPTAHESRRPQAPLNNARRRRTVANSSSNAQSLAFNSSRSLWSSSLLSHARGAPTTPRALSYTSCASAFSDGWPRVCLGGGPREGVGKRWGSPRT